MNVNDLIQDCKLELCTYYTTELVNKLNAKQILQLHDWHYDSAVLKSEHMICDENKFERLSKIITEALEQSDSNIRPQCSIDENLNLDEIKGENIFFHTKNDNSDLLKDIKSKKDSQINLFV